MKLFVRDRDYEAELQRRASSATDEIVQGILARADGGGAGNAATAALEIAAGLVGRAFAAGEVTGDASGLLDAAMLNQIGRSLIRNGQWVGVVMPSSGAIRVACDWDISGAANEGAWTYKCNFPAPSGQTAAREYPSRRVIHLRYAVPVNRPWAGLSPLQVASIGGALSSETASMLADESGGPRGYLLPVPDSDGQSTRVAALRTDIAGLKGRLATIESQQSLAADGGVRRFREWEAVRIGSKPPDALVNLHQVATTEVLAACGVPVALVAADSPGTAIREAWRIFLFSTIAPLGRIVTAELGRKIGASSMQWDELRASDLAGRARAFQSMVGAGMELERAAALSGLMDGE